MNNLVQQDSALPSLPQALMGYAVLQCLAEKECVQTYLAERREDGELFVIKVYAPQAFDSREGEILRGLNHPGIPRLVTRAELDGWEYVVITYAHGCSMEELRVMPGFSGDLVIAPLIRLCDILAYLHSQMPPVIHRDIKPDNVIVGGDGAVSLIDFEISRQYNQLEKKDTVLALTPAFAAPEQFGYAQSSFRSDIYAVGVLLLYMLTGSTDVEQAETLLPTRALSRIIQRCTAFSPQDRYRDVRALQRDLRRVQTRARQRARWIALMAVVATLALCAGMWLGFGYAAGRPAGAGPLDPVAVVFSEPLVESAVRLRLGLDATVPIYPADLNEVTELYINGDRAAKTMVEYWIMCERREEYAIGEGDLTTLEDLTQMKNLENVFVIYQPLEQVDALASLSRLQKVDLRHNEQLTDISGLSRREDLLMLWLNGSPVKDFSAIAGKSIADLQFGGTGVTSLAFLRDTPGIRYLNISYTNIADLSPLLSLPDLEFVEAYNYSRRAFEALGTFSFEVELSPNINPRLDD